MTLPKALICFTFLVANAEKKNRKTPNFIVFLYEESFHLMVDMQNPCIKVSMLLVF